MSPAAPGFVCMRPMAIILDPASRRRIRTNPEPAHAGAECGTVRAVRRGNVIRRPVAARALALATSVAITLITAATATAATFSAHGSAEQVYVTGLAPHEEMALVAATGTTVAVQRADSLGGLLFRNVTPGSGYRVSQYPSGAES